MPDSFFSLPSATAFGRKSATAAAITTTSASSGRRRRRRGASPRPSRRAAVVTRRRRGTVSGPRIRRTSAPRDDASAATATPIFPVERFPMNRTGSIGSCVGPAVTTIRTPSRSCRSRDRALDRSEDVLRLGEPAEPFVAGGERPDDGTDEHGTSLGERRGVRGRRGMLPHAGMHRGGQDQRTGRLEQRRREQVVGDPRGELRDDVGRGGSDDGDVDVVRQMDVHDLAGVVPERRLDRIAGERRERVGADEPLGRVRQDHADVGAGVDQEPSEQPRLVCGDAPRDAEQHPSSGERGATRRRAPRVARSRSSPRRSLRGRSTTACWSGRRSRSAAG